MFTFIYTEPFFIEKTNEALYNGSKKAFDCNLVGFLPRPWEGPLDSDDVDVEMEEYFKEEAMGNIFVSTVLLTNFISQHSPLHLLTPSPAPKLTIVLQIGGVKRAFSVKRCFRQINKVGLRNLSTFETRFKVECCFIEFLILNKRS